MISPYEVSQDLILLLDRIKQHTLALAEERGLTRVQLLALYLIDQHGELAMQQTAGMLHCDASNVTGIVDRLVGQDLILRQENTQDRRVKTLRLTPKGIQLIESVKEALPHLLGCDTLTANERDTLHQLIKKLVI